KLLNRIWLVLLAFVMIGEMWRTWEAWDLPRKNYPDASEKLANAIDKMKESRPISSLAIWGWVPGVYLLTGMPPATRDAIGHFVITEGAMQPYFRARFLNDLRAHEPDLFVDAVAPG